MFNFYVYTIVLARKVDEEASKDESCRLTFNTLYYNAIYSIMGKIKNGVEKFKDEAIDATDITKLKSVTIIFQNIA